MRRILLLCAASSVYLWAADPGRGARLMDDAGCLACHTVWGQGAGHEPSGKAPELGANLVRAYTVPALAAAVWNHTPAMLSEMSEERLNRPRLTAADWEDVFADLYSIQFLAPPAEAGRGKQVFQQKQCASCHALSGQAESAAKPVSEWKPIADPVVLVDEMWNHASLMEAAGREASKEASKMDGRDFIDLGAYLQQLQKIARQDSFTLPEAGAGKPVFDQKCGACHTGALALESRLANMTWMDIGAGMWNHVALMRRIPQVNEEEMRQILSYVWELQYRGPTGDPLQGRATFAAKGCASCHDGGAAGKAVTPASIAAIGWGEGRRMHQNIVTHGVAWPQLTAEDVGDVAAYMRQRSGK